MSRCMCNVRGRTALFGESAQKAAERYEGYRGVARETTHETLAELAATGEFPEHAFAGLRFAPIDDDAVSAAVPGWGLRDFPWREIVWQARPYVRRFEVAIWRYDDLQGLCVGRASEGREHVTIHYLERRWRHNPYEGWVAQIVADIADNYGKILGSQWLRIRNPEPGAIRRYEGLGFSLAKTIMGNTYYRRRI
jgi:hypothetical protein